MSGVPLYVGKGKAGRWLDHQRNGGYKGNRHLRRVIADALKLGIDLPKVKIREHLTEVEAFEVECSLIAALGRVDIDSKIKTSKALKGRAKTEEHKKALVAALRNGSAAKISQALKGKPKTVEHIQKVVDARKRKGFWHTEETKVKLAASTAQSWATRREKFGPSGGTGIKSLRTEV